MQPRENKQICKLLRGTKKGEWLFFKIEGQDQLDKSKQDKIVQLKAIQVPYLVGRDKKAGFECGHDCGLLEQNPFMIYQGYKVRVLDWVISSDVAIAVV